MPSAPLQLVSYRVSKLVVEAEYPDFDEDELDVVGEAPDVDWNVYFNKFSPAMKADRYLVEMKIGFGARGKTVTRGAIELEGSFDIIRTTPRSEVERLASVNAPTILYGTARGLVGAATAMVAGGKYILPPLSFDELLRSKSRGAKRPGVKKRRTHGEPTAGRAQKKVAKSRRVS